MHFIDILKDINHEAFKAVLSLQQLSEKEEQEYISFVEYLLGFTPVLSEGTLSFSERDDDDVVLHLKDDDMSYGIDFIPWEEVLGFQVNQDALLKSRPEDFIFHVLYDMSFDGFEREERDSRVQSILDRIEHFKPNQ